MGDEKRAETPPDPSQTGATEKTAMAKSLVHFGWNSLGPHLHPLSLSTGPRTLVVIGVPGSRVQSSITAWLMDQGNAMSTRHGI